MKPKLKRNFFVVQIDPQAKATHKLFNVVGKKNDDEGIKLQLEDGTFITVPNFQDGKPFFSYSTDNGIFRGDFFLTFEDSLIDEESDDVLYSGGMAKNHVYYFLFSQGNARYTLCIPCQDKLQIIENVVEYKQRGDVLIYSVRNAEEPVSAFLSKTQDFVNLGEGMVTGEFFYSKKESAICIIAKDKITKIPCQGYYTQGRYRIVATTDESYRIFEVAYAKAQEIEAEYFFFDRIDKEDKGNAVEVLKYEHMSCTNVHADGTQEHFSAEEQKAGSYSVIATEADVELLYANAYLRKNGSKGELYCYKDDKPFLIDSGRVKIWSGLYFTIGKNSWKVDPNGCLYIPDEFFAKKPKKWWQFWK